MAKARIVYDVDDKELKKVQKELKDLQKEGVKTTEKFGETWGWAGEEVKKTKEEIKKTNEEVKKSKTSLVDLKGAIAGLGLAALAGAAIKEFVQLNAEINKSRKEVALLTKATGLALDSITAKLRATSKVFDKDFNELLRAANTLSKEFGISMPAALDEINEGFKRGLDVNGEYLDTLKEYSTFIKEAGLNTRQFNVLIQQQAQQGIFSDKGIDAIKEAVISIREMTPATRDAIRGVGIDTEQMIADIQAGTTTYFEAVQRIAVETRELADPVKTGTILADVFRGAGEDAGNFIFTLDKVGKEFAELTGEQDSYITAQGRLLDATEETQKQLLTLTSNTQQLGTSLSIFWEKVKSDTVGGLNTLIEAFTSAENQIANFKRSVAGADKESLQSAIKELNEELEKEETNLKRNILNFGDTSIQATGARKAIRVLTSQIEDANIKIEELTQSEIDEAEAARLDAIAAKELAEAKGLQAEATEKARKESEASAKAMEKEAEATEKARGVILEDLTIKDASNKKSAFLQEVEAKAEQNEILKEQEKKLNDDLVEINKVRIVDVNEAEIEAQEAKRELLETSIQGFAEITSGFANLRIQQIGVELQAVELARNRELELAEGNKDKELEINEKFNAQKRDLQKKQANTEKANALFQIALNTAIGIANAASKVITAPLIPVIAAIGAAQAALVLAQPIPGFKEGVLKFKGTGTQTSDSNLVRISNEESVMTAQETNDYYPALKAIRNREISPDILNNIALNRDTQPTIVVNDYDKLAKAVMRQPQKNIIADENGFTGYIVSQSQVIQKKQSKYRM